jgi:O-antigen ligase
LRVDAGRRARVDRSTDDQKVAPFRHEQTTFDDSLGRSRSAAHATASQRPSFLRVEHLPDVLLAGGVALLVATPLIPSEATFLGVQTPFNVIWLLLLLGWSVGVLLRKQPVVKLGWTELALAGLIGWQVVSTIVAGMEGHGRQALNMMWQWVIYGVVVLLLRQLIRTDRQERALSAIMIGVALILSTHAYYQYFYSMERLRQAFDQNPEMAFAGAAWPIDGGSPAQKLIASRVHSREPLATFALTNSLAGYLAPWLVVTLAIAMVGLKDRRYGQMAVAFAIAAALAGCLFLTKSRTAFLATTAGAGLLLLYGPRHGWRVDWKLPVALAAAAGLIGLIAFYVGGLDIQVLSEAPLSVRYRLEYWRATSAMIANHPLFGSGPGNFQEYYAHHKLPQSSEMVQDPHNFVFEIWATAGTPALLFLLGMIGAFVYEHWRRRDEPQVAEPEQPPPSKKLNGVSSDAKSSHSTAWIYGGAIAGVFLSIPVGLITGYPQEPSDFGLPVPLIFGLPVAIVGVWALRDWVTGGELPRSVPVIALLCLLINLLAAGAATFPGVVNAAWVLLVLALPHRTNVSPSSLASWQPAAPLLAVLAVLFAFIFTQYRPVLNSRTYLSEGDTMQTLGRLQAADTLFQQAAAADPWASEPWRKLLDLRLRIWYENQTPQNWRRFEAAVERFLDLDKQSYAQYESAALSYASAAGASPSDERRERTVDLMKRAVELYPNGAMVRAQYAWYLHRAGRKEQAAEQAAEALRLDSLHNHSEHKLSALQIYDGGAQDALPNGLRPETAEQSMKRLRNR